MAHKSKKKPSNDVDSIEFKLFDKSGKTIFKWGKAPRNIMTARRVLEMKGIQL